MRKHEYEDYEPDIFEERDNDERYYSDDYMCPECGSRKKKYIEKFEVRGAIATQELWECPICGE